MSRDVIARHFPEFALEVRTPRLSLRIPDDDECVALADLAAELAETDAWEPTR